MDTDKPVKLWTPAGDGGPLVVPAATAEERRAAIDAELAAIPDTPAGELTVEELLNPEPTDAGFECGCQACPECKPHIARVAGRTGRSFLEVLLLAAKAEHRTLEKVLELGHVAIGRAEASVTPQGPNRAERRRAARQMERRTKAQEAQAKAARAMAKASRKGARRRG